MVAKLKGARDGSDALNGKYDEPKSDPAVDYASVAPGQRRRSLPGFTAFLDPQGLSDQVHTRGPGLTRVTSLHKVHQPNQRGLVTTFGDQSGGKAQFWCGT
jgi:hypothetical protein